MSESSFLCDPFWYHSAFDGLLSRTLEDSKHSWGDYIDAKELQDKAACLYDYLRDYIEFADAGRPTDRQVEALYQKTLKMFDGAVEARDIQANSVKEQQGVLEDMLYQDVDPKYHNQLDNIIDKRDYTAIYSSKDPPNFLIDTDTSYEVPELLNKHRVAHETIQSLEYDKGELRAAKKKYCENKTDRLDKVLCIEKFATMAHTRGPYASTACGFPMPEYIIEENRDSFAIEELGIPATAMSKAVFDCLMFGPGKIKPHVPYHPEIVDQINRTLAKRREKVQNGG